MLETISPKALEAILVNNLPNEIFEWLQKKLNGIISEASAKDLYLTYSMLSSKVADKNLLHFNEEPSALDLYLQQHDAGLLEISRIYLLVGVLTEKPEYFTPKVANLIQIADQGELEALLKYLILLPGAERFTPVAVEALRTNIATVFDAISQQNPFPAKFFNNLQWNQMYLKAAFMGRNLAGIIDVDERANEELARIISDYAHERWAASRSVDPYFWRPVSNFLKGGLLNDMERLLQSEAQVDNYAAALCCYHSKQEAAKKLLESYPKLTALIEEQKISWQNLNT